VNLSQAVDVHLKMRHSAAHPTDERAARGGPAELALVHAAEGTSSLKLWGSSARGLLVWKGATPKSSRSLQAPSADRG
jgi:hypothetical protein